MSRFWGGSGALGVATLLALLVPAQVIDAQTRHKHRNGADLVVTHVIVDTGALPDYLIEQPNGDLDDMNVDVTVRNAGNRTAGKSILKVKIHSGARGRQIGVGYADIPALKPGHHHTVTIGASGLKLSVFTSLHPIDVVATANWNFHVPETHYTNNSRLRGNIPVIAQQWKVTKWSATTSTVANGVTFDNKNQANGGMLFKYKGFDAANHIFDYTVSGGITQSTNVSSKGCSGSGSGSASHPSWPAPLSEFATDYSQTHYFATIYTKNESTYTVNFACNGSNGTANVHFFDLVTTTGSPGPLGTSPGATTLQNSATVPHGFTSITYSWQFDADVP